MAQTRKHWKHWWAWPEAIYVVCYDLVHLPKKDQESIVMLLFDANTFLAVEDFAKGNCPEDYEISSIEKSYGSTAKMFGGKDGKWIDARLHDGDVEFLYPDPGKEVAHNAAILKRRAVLKHQIVEIVREKKKESA